MTILAIETSCDDTCVAILKVKSQKSKFKSFDILSNVISSQVKLHAKYGGVWPFLAKREHQRNLPIVFKKAVREAKNPKIDLIAVTVGPGLEPCLWTGVNFAKDLAKELKVPIVPVNHIEAHIFANWLPPVGKISNFQPPLLQAGAGPSPYIYGLRFSIFKRNVFPAICLIVSGGHTQLILMRDFGIYKILGETRDDAAGECFDKVARILGLGYPGGPAIALQAAKFKKTKINKYTPVELLIRLPRPMIHQKNYDFSFSGLKTAVLYQIKDKRFKIKDKRYVQEMCKEVQQAIIDVLISKTIRAAREYKAKTIILGGGVAANKELRKQFKEAIEKQIPNTLYLIPKTSFCTDNAAMVAAAGYFNWLKGKKKKIQDIEVNANLRL